MTRRYRRSIVLFTELPSFSAELATASEKTAATVFEEVIKLSARVPDDARTAKLLGTARQWYAVVIDSGGLALTIGYIILGAGSATLITDGGGDVPAQIVTYDHDRGFGLMRAVRPLRIDPVRLADSRDVSDGAKLLAVERLVGSASMLSPTAIFPAIGNIFWRTQYLRHHRFRGSAGRH